MRTRIRYHKYGEITKITDWYTIGPNQVVRAIIFVPLNKWKIVLLDSSTVYEGVETDLRKCKLEIRKSLLVLGVKFEDEIRFGS